MVPIGVSRLLSLLHKRFFTISSSSAATSASNLSSSSPLPNSTSSSSLTLEFLTGSCGLPLPSALSVSKKFQIHPNKLQNSQSVLQFLKAHNFRDSHIAKLIQRRPQVLHSRIISNLKPKFEFFIESGIVGKPLIDVMVTNTHIFRSHLDSHIKPRFETLKSIFGGNKDTVAVIKRAPWLFSLGSKVNMQQNIDFLRKEGVPLHRIAKLCRLFTRAILYKHDRVIYTVNAVKNLGINPEDAMFI